MPKEKDKTPLQPTWGKVTLRGKLKIKDDTFTKGQQMQIGNEIFNGLQSSKPKQDGSISPWKRIDLNLGIDVGGRTEYFRINQGAHIVYNQVGMIRKGEFSPLEFKVKLQDKDDRSKTHNIEVAWNERKEDHIVSNMHRVFGNLYHFRLTRDEEGNLEHKKFFHMFDAYDYLKENLKNGMEVEVTGRYEYQYYNGKQQANIMATSIVIPFPKTETNGQGVEVEVPFKHGMEIEQQVILDAESYRWKDLKDNKLIVDARVTSWLSKDEKGNVVNQNVPYNFPFTLQFQNAEDAEIRKPYYDEWFSVKRKNIRMVNIILEGAGGSQKQSIDMDNLPPETKRLLDLKIISKESLSGGLVNTNYSRELIFKQPKMTFDSDGIPQFHIVDEWCEVQDLEIDFRPKMQEEQKPLDVSEIKEAVETPTPASTILDNMKVDTQQSVEEDMLNFNPEEMSVSPMW